MGIILLRIPVVAQRQGRTPDADLTGLLRFRNQLVLPIQQEHILIGERTADGDTGGIIPLRFQNVVGAVTGDFRGAIKIYQHRLWQMLFQFLQCPQGHHLAAEQDLVYGFRGFVV